MPKIAAIQMCSTITVAENLKKVATMILESAENGAQLVVLPEMFAIIGLKSSDKVKVKENFGDGQIQAFLAEQARKHNIWIIGGTIPITGKDENKIRASCLVFDNKGACVARYDKIHLFDIAISESEKYQESATTEPGDEVVVVATPFGKIGLAVCYDLRFPELFRCLFNKGAELIAIPSAFTVTTGEAHWELLTRSRAVENFCYVIGACQGGVHTSGRKTYGHSMIVEPWGNIAAERTDDSEGIIYADIQLNKVYEARRTMPIEKHQKIFSILPNYIHREK